MRIFLKEQAGAEKFGNRLLLWYRKYRRQLPWRDTRDPYRIWLSEIILQQTRVAQGLPYYQAFIRKYPDVFALAAATEQEVLYLWQGLGYYSRARNMHHTAQTVVRELEGRFPSSYQELLKLKGVGDYTAAAIASFAFDEQVAVVDGNVFRVFSRYFGVAEDVSEPKTKAVFKALAETVMPAGKAATFNQATMEFGALQCTPAAPLCDACVLNDSCYAYAHGEQSRFPVKSKKVNVHNRYIHYIVALQEDRMVLRERKGKDIWTGLYDFVTVETGAEELDGAVIAGKLAPEWQGATLCFSTGPVKHVLSHQRIYAVFWMLQFPAEKQVRLPENTQFYTPEEISQLPKPVLISAYLAKFFIPL